ncbi:MAG: ribosomal protein S18-alanine N-acetyltransferase [Calditrichaeota bacterium]|nr:ribosomal protein S18-alanine N-acetyltransferase [Candidatus Cloacimonadota bacterium]MCA9786371.1 ribosomal protein S18-alanine N-acetyltransferase [Candidatus Cloacimonadota bacterium]MCB1047861.1 ribosomal protein S18-alanine N-acetyltransferase [Calditrichota bacterium]MCB9474660.1 ribosomal protein S18-alanine N-acetyltransferase [Candidatus Delongbacteria bacterium]
MCWRALSPADLPVLESLEALCFSDPWTPAALAAALGEHTGLALGLPGGRFGLQAFALGRVVLDDAELHSIAVDPEERGQGLGRRLLRVFCEQARARGARHLFLEVRSENAVALGLYRSEGFVRLRELPDYYGPGQHGLAFVLPLDRPGAFS